MSSKWRFEFVEKLADELKVDKEELANELADVELLIVDE
jgi:hypothetical protein